MRFKMFYLTGLFFIAVLLAGCTTQTNSSTQGAANSGSLIPGIGGTEGSGSIAGPGTIPGIGKSAATILQEKISECEKKTVSVGRDACFKELALSELNLSFCDRIENPEIATSTVEDAKISCKREVSLASAIDSKNPANCATLSTAFEIDKCYGSIAISLKDEKICSSISELSAKDACYQNVAVLAKNDSICLSIASPQAQNVCYAQVAVAELQPTLCEKIQSAIVLKDQCYLDIVKVTKDTRLCENIFTDNLKKDCQALD